jgi:hypothetical protein
MNTATKLKEDPNKDVELWKAGKLNLEKIIKAPTVDEKK